VGGYLGQMVENGPAKHWDGVVPIHDKQGAFWETCLRDEKGRAPRLDPAKKREPTRGNVWQNCTNGSCGGVAGGPKGVFKRWGGPEKKPVNTVHGKPDPPPPSPEEKKK